MQLLKFFFMKEMIEPLPDPLSHPDVARMSLTELADLPLMPEAGATDVGRPLAGDVLPGEMDPHGCGSRPRRLPNSHVTPGCRPPFVFSGNTTAKLPADGD